MGTMVPTPRLPRHTFRSSLPVAEPPGKALPNCLDTFLTHARHVSQSPVPGRRLKLRERTIAAFSYRRSQGLPFIYPDPSLRYCANFLHMVFSILYRQYVVAPEIEDALNLVFILHYEEAFPG